MGGKQPYEIGYDRATRQHLRAIEAKYHSLIRAAIEDQLLKEPNKATPNRNSLL